MAAKRRKIAEGDIFAVPLEDGRFGALRVLRCIATNTRLLAVTRYIGQALPAAEEPLLRTILRYVWHERPSPCVCWYRGNPPASATFITSVPATQAEKALGGKDAGSGFGGRWAEGLGWQVLWAWEWEHDRASLERRLESARTSSLARPERKPRPLDDDTFWPLIARVVPTDEARGTDALVSALRAMPAPKIRGFDDALAAKLWALDGRAWAEQIGEHCYRGDAQFFSVDNFLYARCAVVARGRSFYEAVLADPARMPKEETFEPLLYAGGTAYEAKTHRDYDHDAVPSWETFANEAAWGEPAPPSSKDRRGA